MKDRQYPMVLSELKVGMITDTKGVFALVPSFPTITTGFYIRVGLLGFTNKELLLGLAFYIVNINLSIYSPDHYSIWLYYSICLQEMEDYSLLLR
jgi:hypothetical protein